MSQTDKFERFEGKVAMVAGSGTGEGAATALRLAAEGADLHVADVDQEKLLEVVREAETYDVSVSWSLTDVSDRRQVEDAVEIATGAHGRLDCLVNDAGIYESRGLLDVDETSIARMFAVDLYGPFVVAQVAARAMAKSGGGAISNTSSISGLIGDPAERMAHYAAAKGALASFTRQAAIELARSDIRINAICPGPHRAGRPADVAGLHAFLLSDDASYITGSIFPIDSISGRG
jgi:NAD(P)-dependent dehydrogenase (short-subunit alcohol dehydrogenase family)